MSEAQPAQPESESKLAYPITEIVPGISEYDADLLTRIAQYDQLMGNTPVDREELAYLMPWALDQAYTRPHATAQFLQPESTLSPALQQGLRLGYEAQRSDIAYRVTANQRITWMARINGTAYQVVMGDRIFAARRNDHMFEPNAPWLYRKMQSRLLICIAWMAEGKPMEGRLVSPAVRERFAAEAGQYLFTQSDEL